MSTGINPSSKLADHGGAAARAEASIAVRVRATKAAKYAGAVKDAVNDAVYRDHRCTGRHPSFPLRIGAKKQLSQDHRPNLWAGASDVLQRLYDGSPHYSRSISTTRPAVSGNEPIIDPADEVAVADVANEQREADSGLAE